MMPPSLAPRSVINSRFIILGGMCMYPVPVVASSGPVEIDIDVEIADEPVVRTGAIVGALTGQGAGPQLTWSVNEGVITFTGGGGPNAPDGVAMILFPAEEAR